MEPNNQVPPINPSEQQQVVAPQQPQYAAPAVPVAEDPGKTLAILGLVLGFVITPLVGLILSIIARNKSKSVGIDNSLAKIGIIINAILLAIGVLAFIGFVLISVLAAANGHATN